MGQRGILSKPHCPNCRGERLKRLLYALKSRYATYSRHYRTPYWICLNCKRAFKLECKTKEVKQ